MSGVERTRAFFGPRAAGWESRFPDDGPLYVRAVAELAPPVGGTVLDAACGTGRALPALRAAVGAGGTVLGVDLTLEMLEEAAALGRGPDPVGRRGCADLILADVTVLPLPDASLDAVFAAGLISHLSDPVTGLGELARVCRAGGRLALFHPLGRAALARRHGHEPEPDDIRAEPHIRSALATSGWHCQLVDDAESRYLVLAVRAGPTDV